MTVTEMERAMDTATERLDFEEAARLRDRIAIARQTGVDPGPIEDAGLLRQQPGAMGIGSSQPRPVRPAGWVKPTKPDPLTRNRSR